MIPLSGNAISLDNDLILNDNFNQPSMWTPNLPLNDEGLFTFPLPTPYKQMFVYLMVCTIVNGKGYPMKEGAVLNRLSERLTGAICQSIRHSDTVCKYSKNQYLILLINTTREDCAIVEERIDRNFRTEGQRTGLKFHVSPVEALYL